MAGFTGGAAAVVGQVLSGISQAAESRTNTAVTTINGLLGQLAVAPATLPFERLTQKITDAKALADATVPYDRVLPLSEVTRLYGEGASATVLTLAQSFDDFLNAQFPITSSYVTYADQWLADQLFIGGSGVNTTVEDQIWARERSRVLRDAARATDEAMTQWAGRGFSMPPGSLAHRVAVIDREAQEKIAEAGRERAIVVFKTELDQVRFALTQALDLRSKAIADSLEYMKATAMASLDKGLETTQNLQAAHQRLNDTLFAFYKTDLEGKDFTLKLRANDQSGLRAKEDTDLSAKLKYIDLKTSAVISVTQSLGQQAAAALNGMHANAQISGSDVTTTNL